MFCDIIKSYIYNLTDIKFERYGGNIGLLKERSDIEIFQSTMTNDYLCFIIVKIERKREVINVKIMVVHRIPGTKPFSFFNILAMMYPSTLLYIHREIEVKIDLRYFFSSLPTAHAPVNKSLRVTA